MRKFWVVFLSLIFTGYAYGFDIVYPKKNNVVINSPTTFFIGASKEPITINGEVIKLHPTGAFAHFVKLPSNSNTFTIKSGSKTEIFNINKN